MKIGDLKLVIEYTAHAEQRSIERGIEKEEIEQVLSSPSDEIFDEYEENYHCYGKKHEKEDKYIKIVYSKLNSDIVKVITVMITDIVGLRRNGFNNL